MNRVVREHYPVSKLPEDLREGFDPDGEVDVTVVATTLPQSDAVARTPNRPIHDWSPERGYAFQGDICLIPVPPDIVIEYSEEVPPKDGKLVLLEGEGTGHHHVIVVKQADAMVPSKNSATVEQLMDDARHNRIPLPAAKLYRDPAAARALMNAGILPRTDLTIDFLIVEHGSMVLAHEEHDAVRVPPGRYYVGRQVESAVAEGKSTPRKLDLFRFKDCRRSNYQSIDEVVAYVRSLRDEWTDRER